jgi:hypothetical protein
MPLPPSRLTRGEIITQALNRVGNTKIRRGARIGLNRLLESLYLSFEWPFLHTTLLIAVSPSATSFPLPADFTTTIDDYGLQVIDNTADGLKTRVAEVSPSVFEMTANPTRSLSQYPQVWMPARATTIGHLWPQPEQAITLQLRYYALPADMPVTDVGADPTYDADIPIFPYHQYLIDAVEHWALEYEHDRRAPVAKAMLMESLANIRGRATPHKSTANTIDLDPDVFGTPFRSD